MPAGTKTRDSHIDGRRARGERTRLRVLEALLTLVEEGHLRPTAQEVAARAGVALRTVYHHFEDVEALRGMALDLQFTRHLESLQTVNSSLPLDQRIAIVARQCRKLYEAITPIRRATLFDQQASPEMADGLRRSQQLRRNHIAAAFSKELKSRTDAGRALFDALDVTTSWATWHYLREGLNRSVGAAEKITALMLNNLFRPSTKAKASR